MITGADRSYSVQERCHWRWWWRRHRQQQQQQQQLENLGQQRADSPISNEEPVSPRQEFTNDYAREPSTSSKHIATTSSRQQRQQSSASRPPPTSPSTIATPPPHNPVAGSSKIPRIRGTTRTRLPAKKRRKKIDFVEPARSKLSQITLSSVEVVRGTSVRPLKSALRSTSSSLRSSTSSVRFSLPPDNDWKGRCTGGKIGQWWRIFEEDTTRRNTKNWFETCRCLLRTTYCRLMTCFICGIILPSLLIVPVLVYKNVTLQNDTRT